MKPRCFVEEERADIDFRSWQILLQKSAATDWAIEPFVESRALKRWP
jgi:hypothetical protein